MQLMLMVQFEEGTYILLHEEDKNRHCFRVAEFTIQFDRDAI